MNLNDFNCREWIELDFGLTGRILFYVRLLVQWLSSEREPRSIIPLFSISGGMVLLADAVYRQDPIFMVGQLTGIALV